MPNENSLKNLTPFTSTYQPANRGRKPSKLRKYIKDNGLSSRDMQLILSQFVNMDREKLKELAANPKAPILVSGIAAALLKDMMRGRTDTQQWIIDRIHGRAVQPIEHSGGIDPVQSMTPEERKAYLKEAIKKYRERENNTD